MSSSLGAGKEISSYCGKCQLKLAHIIMSMHDSKTPHKVQCKTCNSTHLFKSSAPRAAATKKAAPSRSANELWGNAMKIAGAKPKKEYTLRGKFTVGDVIQHPTFGVGFVQSNLSNEKIEVLFQDDFKNLVHGKN